MPDIRPPAASREGDLRKSGYVERGIFWSRGYLAPQVATAGVFGWVKLGARRVLNPMIWETMVSAPLNAYWLKFRRLRMCARAVGNLPRYSIDTLRIAMGFANAELRRTAV